MSTTSPARPTPADPGALSRKSFNCRIKALDDAGNFTLLAAVYGNVDRGGDLIDKGAAANLDDFVKDGWIAVNHDSQALPVAYPTAASQGPEGLTVSGTFHSTPEAQACRTVVRERFEAGKSVPASIGYRSNEESYERIQGQQIRRLKKISIYEVSFVNLPMNPLAGATAVKGVEPVKPTEEPMPELEPKGTALDQLKRLLGISTKKSVAISAANREQLKSFGGQLDEHHGKLVEAVKSMRDCHKAMADTISEFKAFVSGFDPADDDDDVEANEKPAGKVEPKDGDKSAPTPTEADRTKAALLAQLKQRSIAGRSSQVCP